MPTRLLLPAAGVTAVAAVVSAVFLLLPTRGTPSIPTDRHRRAQIEAEDAIAAGAFDQAARLYSEALASAPPDERPFLESRIEWVRWRIASADIEKRLARAREAVASGRPSRELYDEAAAACGPGFEGRRASIRRERDSVEANFAAAQDEWRALRAEYQGNRYDPRDLRDRMKRARARHAPMGASWIAELDRAVEVLDHQVAEDRSAGARAEFQDRREEIRRLYLQPGEEDFAAALRAWKAYRGEPKVKAEIVAIEREAAKAWETLKSADAETLRSRLPRFEGCAVEKEIRDRIARLEK